MIRIITEASWERETADVPVEDFQAPAPPKVADLASVLNPLKNIDGIPEMQKSVKTLQGFIQKAGGDIGSLRVGVESIYYSMWPLTNLDKLQKKGWYIEPKDTSDGKAPVMTFSDFRKWIMDDQIQWSKIETTLDGIIAGGSKIRKMLTDHKVEEERDYNNPKVGYASIDLKGESKVIDDLCAQGTKGGSFNAYGPYEKLLSLVVMNNKFPKDGSQGEGDISFGNILIEVKSVDTGNLKSKCKIPKPQDNFTDGGLLLARRTGNLLEVLYFKDQAIMDCVLKHGQMLSVKPDPKTDKRKTLKYAIDKKGVDAIFAKQGVLNRRYLISAGYAPSTNQVEQQPPEDEYTAVDDTTGDAENEFDEMDAEPGSV